MTAANGINGKHYNEGNFLFTVSPALQTEPRTPSRFVLLVLLPHILLS